MLGYLGYRALPRKQRAAAADAAGRQRARQRARLPGRLGRHGHPAAGSSSLLLAVVALGVDRRSRSSRCRPRWCRPRRTGSTQARAEQLLADGFGPGFNGPLTVLFEGDGAAEAAAGVSGADRRSWTTSPLVTPPIPNADGTAALLTVIPESGPTDPATEQLVADLRAELADLDGVDASVTGATAVSVDVAQSLDDGAAGLPGAGRRPGAGPAGAGVPLAAGAAGRRARASCSPSAPRSAPRSRSSSGAGWPTLVNLDSTGPLISLTPILVIGILFGLAMDYQIFLVSRMHEAHSHGAAPLDAIRTGFRQAAPVVVAAALIMFSVFAGFVAGR